MIIFTPEGERPPSFPPPFRGEVTAAKGPAALARFIDNGEDIDGTAVFLEWTRLYVP